MQRCGQFIPSAKTLMESEVSDLIGAERYERSGERTNSQSEPMAAGCGSELKARSIA
jgi:hypothetical protein